MRLSPVQCGLISRTAAEIFEDLISVKLFGSRLDDGKKGGDIDLLVLVPEHALSSARARKFKFLDELQGLIGEQRIDIVISSPEKVQADEFLRGLESVELS